MLNILKKIAEVKNGANNWLNNMIIKNFPDSFPGYKPLLCEEQEWIECEFADAIQEYGFQLLGTYKFTVIFAVWSKAKNEYVLCFGRDRQGITELRRHVRFTLDENGGFKMLEIIKQERVPEEVDALTDLLGEPDNPQEIRTEDLVI